MCSFRSFSRLPHISKCCCFISLRTSAYLIGLLQSLVGLVVVIYTLFNSLDKKQHDDVHDADATIRHTTIYTIGGVSILLGVILVIGVKIKNVLLMKVYIALETIVLLVGLIIYVVILIHLFVMAFVIVTDLDSTTFVGDLVKIFAIGTAPVLVIVIVIAFAVIALKAYFLLCVHSHLQDLIWRESGTPRAVGYTAVAETDDNNIKQGMTMEMNGYN